MSELSFPKPKKTSINIFHWNEKPLTLKPRDALSTHQPLHSNTSQVVGFQNDEVTSVLDQLTRGSKQLRIVPIVGMAGLGKTTFALQLYNHVSIRYHFHARAWCSISQVLDKKRVFLFLLNQTKPGTNTSNMSEDDLADEFRKSIIGRTYLIFLDDVWTPQVWDSLNEAFPDDSTSSRVILTSRHHDIAPHDLIADGKPYLLRPREVKECLEILQAKLFPEQGCWPLKLNQLGIEFAKKCKGLPLTVVIVAGLLVTSRKQDWKHILDSLSSGSLSREEQCNSALELSFKHLPNDLKLCFLYFAVFPENEEINVKTLIRYWMAEGFVQKIKSKRIEDVAREYMDRLIEISLVKVAKMRSICGVKTCRIHDLLHEFCQAKARQRNFCSCDQVSDFNESHSLQRLSIHSNPLHFQRSGLFCPSLHSLLFFSTGPSTGHGHPLFHVLYITQIYKLLKVLELGRILLPSKIPSEIGSLTRLAYLSIQSSFCVVPSSIGNLSNLETFIVVFKSNLSEHIPFPHTIWNLKNLKHLHVPGGGLTLPNENLENSPMLLGLETLTGVVFGCNGSMERQMRKFPNIRRLSCGILPDVNKIVIVPDTLGHLESLTITGHCKLLLRFGSTENLRKLSLSFLKLSREDITIIGQFPNLEVLKLWEIFYEGGILEMEEGGFSTVKYLDLTAIDSNLERWIASDEQLPNLKKLVLMGCEQLIEIPSCLNTIPTLEEIQLIGCSPTVESLVRCIEEAQEDYGNSLKVNITR